MFWASSDSDFTERNMQLDKLLYKGYEWECLPSERKVASPDFKESERVRCVYYFALF